MSMGSFPDRRTEIVDIFSEGNKVCVRMHVTGTNEGGVPWIGAPANGNKVDFEWMSIYEVKNGKVTNHWGINDINMLMMQTGVWSPPQM
jgi:predicted ester cyclase